MGIRGDANLVQAALREAHSRAAALDPDCRIRFDDLHSRAFAQKRDEGLEIDHYQIAFENDGPTELWNLCKLCKWHHHLKTHCGYAITGEPGSWDWRGPESERSPVLTS